MQGAFLENLFLCIGLLVLELLGVENNGQSHPEVDIDWLSLCLGWFSIS